MFHASIICSQKVLTYNRQEKMNVDVKEFEDKVTVVRSDGPSQSWVEAALNPGQKFYTPIVAGSGMMRISLFGFSSFVLGDD